MKYADLHVHTSYSDSTFSPEEVISYAKEKALSCIAICDHDSIEGIEPCIKLGAEAGIEVIPSIEMTAEKVDAEIHLLGYFIDWKDEPFRKKLKEIQAARTERVYRIVEKLKLFDIDVDPEDIFRIGGKGTVGRLHIAQAMLNTGKIRTMREAFDKYIGFGKPCYVAYTKLSPKDAVELILRVGGVPVLAHPDIMGHDEYIDELIGFGLKGLEVYHTDHKPHISKRYEAMADKKGLLMTGGSDCHGMGKGRILIGSVRVPYELVEKLREESRRIRDERRQ